MPWYTYYYTALFCLLLMACKANAQQNTHTAQASNIYQVRANFWRGNKFYSLFISKQGAAYAIKGVGAFDTTATAIKQQDTSKIFILTRAREFFTMLEAFKKTPKVRRVSTSSMPEARVYYNQKNVYETNVADGTFWKLFKPIMEQVPEKFNPFLVSAFN